MHKVTRKLSVAKVLSFVALFVALSGVAHAGLGKDTVKSKTIKNGAVKTVDLANGAVTSEKLAPGVGASAAHVARNSAPAPLNALGAEITSADSVISLNLPAGNWVVQAQATFGSNAAAERNIQCVLLDTNNPLSGANTHTRALATFSASLSLVGVSDGGITHLSCATDPAGAQVRERTIVATQVGTVTGP